MNNSYHIDPSAFSIQKFQESISSRNLIPSRRILKENTENRFGILLSLHINSLENLMNALKTKDKIYAFSEKSSIPVDYLIILNREAKSFLPNPISLSKFTHIQEEVLNCLEKHGIKNTRHLFNLAQDENKVNKLIDKCSISQETLNELVALSDLGRAYGVGPVFAKMLFNLGIDSIDSLIQHSPADIIVLYEEVNGKKADFTHEDIKFSLDLAQLMHKSSKKIN